MTVYVPTVYLNDRYFISGISIEGTMKNDLTRLPIKHYKLYETIFSPTPRCIRLSEVTQFAQSYTDNNHGACIWIQRNV